MRVAFYLYLAVLAVLCFGSFPGLPAVSEDLFGLPTDKVVHFVMFFPFPILTFLAYDNFMGNRKEVLVFALITFLLGCFIAAGTEVGQSLFTTTRVGDVMDFLADVVALVSGSAIALLMELRRFR